MWWNWLTLSGAFLLGATLGILLMGLLAAGHRE